ncbi:MAG: leukotriene A4 hydrolase C-terminal domain-containing protein, partial [Planctomycetota bacterium]
PDNCPAVKTDELAKVAQAAKEFLGGQSAEGIQSTYQTADWTTHHWNHFLRSFKDAELSVAQMQDLDTAFKFSKSGNSEITHDWLWLVIDAEYEPAYLRLESFLTSQGRRKFLQPLYQKLAETEQGLARAKQIYTIARPGYHSVSSTTIDGILGVE